MGKVSEKTLDEIKDRVDIVELISAHLELKAAGNTHKGLCPFHNEKTPSFNVDRAKGFYHCFGCGASGDSIAFVMERQNLSFVDAVEALCDTYGVEFVTTGGSSVADKSHTALMRSINEEFLTYACKTLLGDQHPHALKYILDRGFTLEVVRHYQLGFIPDNVSPDNLNTNFRQKDLVDSGVFAISGTGRLYSPFYGRVIFPIHDVRGRLAGFSGRVMDSSRQPKYLNSKDSHIFRKSSLMYNFHNARSFRAEKTLLIVEGYFDVIRMHSVGVGNVVATMGTALTEQHVVNMKKYFEEFTLLFDGDDAGQKAALKSLPTFVKSGVAPMVAFVPDGQDPDDYIVTHANGDAGGSAAIADLLAGKVDLLEYAVTQQVQRSTTPNESHKILAWAGGLVQSFPHAYHREYYSHLVARVCGVSQDVFVRSYMNFARGSTSTPIATNNQGGSREQDANTGMVSLRERDFLAYLLFHSSHTSTPLYMDGLSADHFYDTLCREFYQILHTYYAAGEPLNTFFTRRDSGKFSIIYTRTLETFAEPELEKHILGLKSQVINSEQRARKRFATTVQAEQKGGFYSYDEYGNSIVIEHEQEHESVEKKSDAIDRALQLGNEYIELVKKRKRR